MSAAEGTNGVEPDAITRLERAVADSERTAGPDDPGTLTLRNNLGAAYHAAGRVGDAIPVLERTLAGRELILGPDHLDALGSGSNLAVNYDAAGRFSEAIPLFERCLAGFERILGPDDATTMNTRSNLAAAYTSARRLDQAIPLHQRCLADLERMLDPNDPAILIARNDLAVDYNAAGRIDEAIPLYERCLADFERLLGPDNPNTQIARENLQSAREEARRSQRQAVGPADQAEAQARAYLRRAETSHEDADLERATNLFDQAARFARASGAAPERIIHLEIYAAEVLAKRQTDRTRNLELAIERLTSLRDQTDREAPPASRAALLQSLGTVYQARVDGDPAANMELAIENLEAGLALWDVNSTPDQWASAANNLANAYCSRIRGDNSENLEQAIGYAEAASAIRTYAKDPQLWARTLHSLASMYFQRSFGPKDENIERSIALSRAALEVETRAGFPARWAGSQHNLGFAYLQRVKGDRADNLRTAVSCFRDALSVRSALPALGARGQSLLGLGQALDALGEETGDERARADVISTYQLAAAAFEDLGAADQAAAAYYGAAVSLSRQDGEEPARRAVETAQRCLPAWTAERNPLRSRLLYALLARLTDRLGRTAEAYGWICRSIEANESLYAGAAVNDSKARQDEEGGGWYEVAADLALRSGAAASDALLFAERARARALGESVVRGQPEGGIPAALLASEAALEADRDRAWAGIRSSGLAVGAADGGLAQIWGLAGRLTELREQIVRYAGGAEYVAARTGLVSWEQIRNWVDAQPIGFALLEYLTLPDRVVAFVVRQGCSEPAVVTIPLGQQALHRCANAVFREMDGSSADRVRRETWDRIAAPLVSLVRPELEGVRLLCIVPHQLLCQLPLHALGGPGATLLDQAAVYYAPSARLAMQLSQGGRRTGRARALVIGDTNGDLPRAREEAAEIGEILGVKPLIGDEATLEAVLAQLPGADLVHFACHGYLRLWDPGLSAIRLASDDLTANDIRRFGVRCDLVVLSGCDTGYELGLREPLGLPSVLLAAGARTAIGSLWPVDDTATKELFIRFFAGLASSDAEKGGDEIASSVAGCLQAAELALRETRPERYYWAPFVAIGSW